MTWGDESDEQGILFREVMIPQGVPDPDGELLKTRLSQPQVDPLAPEGRSAALHVDGEVDGQAWKRELRPRHRDVIKKYFDSGPDEPK